MIKIHLAQIFYNPTYYDSPINYLEETTFLTEKDLPIGKLRNIQEIESFLLDSQSNYIEYLRIKLTDIITWSGERGAHLLVFPEYSIPYQLLPTMKHFATKYSMIIVAGTHRIMFDDKAKTIYQDLGIPYQAEYLGCACAPIFLPDGKVQLSMKTRKSKWEPNLKTLNENNKIIEVSFRDTNIRFAVVPCIDALHLDEIGKLCYRKDKPVEILICPSMSPSVEPFYSTGTLSKLHEVVFVYVNTSSYGKSFFNIPSQWKPYLQGKEDNLKELPKNVEAIFELNVDHKNFFTKKGTIKSPIIGTHPHFFPIVYTKTNNWLKKFNNLRDDLNQILKDTDVDLTFVYDWIDSFLTEESQNLPDLVDMKLKNLRRSLLPLWDGDHESLHISTEIIKIANTIDDIKILWANRINKAIEILSNYIQKAPNNLIENIFECLKNLKTLQEKFPPILLKNTENSKTVPCIIKEKIPVFIGEGNLVESFQNRGGEVDTIRNFFVNNENKVIIITGAIGIGKSDFLNWMFRKQFGDWQTIRIHIPTGAKFSRILADIAYKVGITLDIDSLATCSSKIFQRKIRNVLTKFYNCTKVALIIDDLHQMLKESTTRDYKQLKIFIDEASEPHYFKGGRIFLISSQWLPEEWLHKKGVVNLGLKGIRDLYVRRIIEFHMRRLNLIKDEAIPEIPQTLLDIVNGHPLSAKLLVEVLRDKDLQELSDELIKTITGQLAKELLKRVDISSDEQLIMRKLSVFRFPVRLDILKHIDEFELNEIQLMTLAKRCILSYDGQSFEMHEAIRRFYQINISSSEYIKYHKLAALYYKNIYDNKSYSENNPTIIAELVYHLSLSGEIHKVENLRLLIIEELKPTARQIYREYRNYQKALSLYRLIADIIPSDYEVLAYIGRCYARLGQWNDSDQAFQKAIDISTKLKQPIWWIYRDWGHIRARFSFYNEAKRLLEKASTIKPNDSSINATLAYMHWHYGDMKKATELFEEALKLNPYHEYTLNYYPKFLDCIGDNDYANTLRKRLDELDSHYRPPSEYDIDIDYDD